MKAATDKTMKEILISPDGKKELVEDDWGNRLGGQWFDIIVVDEVHRAGAGRHLYLYYRGIRSKWSMENTRKKIEVVAAIIRDGGRIFATQREVAAGGQGVDWKDTAGVKNLDSRNT